MKRSEGRGALSFGGVIGEIIIIRRVTTGVGGRERLEDGLRHPVTHGQDATTGNAFPIREIYLGNLPVPSTSFPLFPRTRTSPQLEYFRGARDRVDGQSSNRGG